MKVVVASHALLTAVRQTIGSGYTICAGTNILDASTCVKMVKVVAALAVLRIVGTAVLVGYRVTIGAQTDVDLTEDLVVILWRDDVVALITRDTSI